MKLIVTGGGTGGHIYPAIAVAKKMKIAMPDAEVLYIGSVYGPEKRLVTQEQLVFQSIHVRSINRLQPIKAFWAVLLLFRALYESYLIMKRFRPDLVLGTGGYASGPVVLMAQIMGIETLIHEQNAVPAWTTKLLSNYASKILISYKESIPYFKNKNRLYYTGNPVREVFLHTNRAESRSALQIPNDAFVVLFHGGSNGAEVINNMAVALMESLDRYENLHIYVLTGKKLLKMVKKQMDIQDKHPRIHVYDYSHQIVRLMHASDLVVCRAGAVALAEMTAIGLPGFLVPNPKSLDSHQIHNASVFSKAEACVVIEEGPEATNLFLRKFDEVFYNRNQLLTMKKNYESLMRENALNTIISIIYTYHLR